MGFPTEVAHRSPTRRGASFHSLESRQICTAAPEPHPLMLGGTGSAAERLPSGRGGAALPTRGQLAFGAPLWLCCQPNARGSDPVADGCTGHCSELQ